MTSHNRQLIENPPIDYKAKQEENLNTEAEITKNAERHKEENSQGSHFEDSCNLQTTSQPSQESINAEHSRHPQEAFAEEVHAEMEKYKLLHVELEKVTVSNLEDALNFETALNNARQQDDILQQELQQEVQQKKSLQKDVRELKDTLKHNQETFTFKEQMKEKNKFLQEEPMAVKVSKQEESLRFETELNNADILQHEDQQEHQKKAVVQKEDKKLILDALVKGK